MVAAVLVPTPTPYPVLLITLTIKMKNIACISAPSQVPVATFPIPTILSIVSGFNMANTNAVGEYQEIK